MHPLVRYLILSGLAFIAVVIEQQFWPHHGRTVGIGFGVLVVVALGTIDSLLGTDRRSAAGDLLVGRVVLVGVAALIVAALLLQVTSLAAYLVLAVAFSLSALFLGGVALLDWWASHRTPKDVDH